MSQPDPGTSKLWFWCPLWVEQRSAKKGARLSLVTRTGMGPKKSVEFVQSLAGRLNGRLGNQEVAPPTVVVLGFGGGLAPDSKPGDVIVATELRGPGETISFSTPLIATPTNSNSPQNPPQRLINPHQGFIGPTALAEQLNGLGFTAMAAPICSVDHVVHGKKRQEIATAGAGVAAVSAGVADAAVVDMESWWLASASQNASTSQNVNIPQNASASQTFVNPTPTAVIRVVLDTPRRPLLTSAFAFRKTSKVLTDIASALEMLVLS